MNSGIWYLWRNLRTNASVSQNKPLSGNRTCPASFPFSDTHIEHPAGRMPCHLGSGGGRNMEQQCEPLPLPTNKPEQNHCEHFLNRHCPKSYDWACVNQVSSPKSHAV